ncbi:MAG: glycosyltransferase family 39 protein [Aquabacterium sp.]|nr:glycosyltransferase family 39 protein [Aquabacterium sp.]
MNASPVSTKLSTPVTLLWLVALGSFGWRLWLSAALPLTGDEALFYWWARFLDYGYYDHPPMVAWWIAAVRTLFGDAAWAVRLPAVLLPLGVGWAMWWAWSPIHRGRAGWAVLLYWLAPVNWLNPLIATDSPLILWAAWSVAAMVRAEQRVDKGQSAWRLYALSGVFMGAAFLSKYFAVLLGLAFFVYFALCARARWRGFALMALFALPAVLLNLVWNINHCWANIMFNVFNRNEGAEASAGTVITYIGMMAYLISPVLLWMGWRHRQALVQTCRQHALLACVALVPLICFGLLSSKKVIGLHWVMGFYPFLFVMLTWAMPVKAVHSSAKGLAVILILHLMVSVGISITRLDQWQSFRYYHRLVEAARSEEMVRQVQSPGVVLASNGYSSAAIFGYAAKLHVPVLGVGSVHARQDDLMVDYSALDGKTIRIMATREPSIELYRPYFDAVQLLTYKQDGATFYAVEGVNFQYPRYRSSVMREVNQKYYNFPSWLPVLGCSFCQQYCGKARCE